MLAFAGYLKILFCLLWLYRHFASWAMSHRHRLLRQCRNTALPSLAISILYLLSYLPLGLLCPLGYFASWATLPLGLASWALYRHSASQAMSHRHCLLWQCRYTDMPLGLLCLLGCFASWATLPLGHYIDTLPLRLCLIDIVCFDNASILICLLGLCHHWALVSMQNDKTC
jgi:hypothetical protein